MNLKRFLKGYDPEAEARAIEEKKQLEREAKQRELDERQLRPYKEALERFEKVTTLLESKGIAFTLDNWKIKIRNKFSYNALSQEFRYVTTPLIAHDYSLSVVLNKINHIEDIGGRNRQKFKSVITSEQANYDFDYFLRLHEKEVMKDAAPLTLFNEDLKATYNDSMMWEVKYTKQDKKTHWVTTEQLSELIDRNIQNR